MMDASSSAALVEVGVLGVFVNDLKTFFLVERADGVGADAEAFLDFALDGFAGGENRLEVQAGHGLQRVESLRGEQAAGGDFHRAVEALERKQFLLQQNAGGKKGEKLTVRFDVIQRGVGEAVFAGQPAQNVLLALHGRLGAGQRHRVDRGQLPGGNHALQQLLQRRVWIDGFVHLFCSGGNDRRLLNFKAALSERRYQFQLIQQSQQGGLGFLFYGQHLAELVLRLQSAWPVWPSAKLRIWPARL